MNDDQRRVMYNKLTKKDVIELLIERDNNLNALSTTIESMPKIATTGVVNWRMEMLGDLQSRIIDEIQT